MDEAYVFEPWSDTLYPEFDERTQRWVIAFDEDGTHYAESTPESDFYIPVPDEYATKEGAVAAIAVLTAWEAPMAANNGDGEMLGFEALRATPEWAALVPYLPQSWIGNYAKGLFEDAADYTMVGGLPGAYEHHLATLAAGAQVRQEEEE